MCGLCHKSLSVKTDVCPVSNIKLVLLWRHGISISFVVTVDEWRAEASRHDSVNVASRGSSPLTTAGATCLPRDEWFCVGIVCGTEVNCFGLALLDNLLQATGRHLSPVSTAACSLQHSDMWGWVIESHPSCLAFWSGCRRETERGVRCSGRVEKREKQERRERRLKYGRRKSVSLLKKNHFYRGDCCRRGAHP